MSCEHATLTVGNINIPGYIYHDHDGGNFKFTCSINDCIAEWASLSRHGPLGAAPPKAAPPSLHASRYASGAPAPASEGSFVSVENPPQARVPEEGFPPRDFKPSPPVDATTVEAICAATTPQVLGPLCPTFLAALPKLDAIQSWDRRARLCRAYRAGIFAGRKLEDPSAVIDLTPALPTSRSSTIHVVLRTADNRGPFVVYTSKQYRELVFVGGAFSEVAILSKPG